MIKPRVFEHTTPQWKVEDSYHVTRRNDGVTLFVPNGKCHITAGHIQWLMGRYLAKCCDAPANGVHPASPGAFVTLFLLALGDAVGASVGVEVSNPSSPHLLGGRNVPHLEVHEGRCPRAVQCVPIYSGDFFPREVRD